ncbi:WD40 family protein [Acanthamoeba polyphaga mimivirus]|nr:WD40 family protein [Acanthamoeba castellanii mamavirus]EJN40548.1 hypothetical protein lvs_L690 [Acanthamoeba polyphaga lentillevirus]UMZ07659.1 WD40 family protein [Acanthamoeba polyphaga mimivirus]
MCELFVCYKTSIMDLDKLYQLAVNNQFTDIILVLEDDKETITIGAHKCILYASCPYFEKMFATTMKESIQSRINIRVPNSHVFCNIISGFYGQKIKSGNIEPWKYQLDTILCRDFLGLEITNSLLNDLIVPPENFDDLLKITELIGFDEFAFDLIIKNIPSDYDLTKLSNELLKCLHDHTISQKILFYNNELSVWQQLNIFNYKANDLNLPKDLPVPKSLKNSTYNFEYDLLAYLDNNETLFVVNIHTNQLTYHIKNMPDTDSIKLISENNLFMVSNNKFAILDLETNQYNKSLEIDNTNFKYSYFCGDIYVCCYEYSIDLYNIVNLELIRTHKLDNKIISLTCSSDNTLIACVCENWNFNMWSIETGELIESATIDDKFTRKFIGINFKYDNNNVIIILNKNCIYQFDIKTGMSTYKTLGWNLSDVIDYSSITNNLILLRCNTNKKNKPDEPVSEDFFVMSNCLDFKYMNLNTNNPLFVQYYTNEVGRKIKSVLGKE